MRRWFALSPKILLCRHDPPAHECGPPSVHSHPRSQRVCRINHPLGQAQPIRRQRSIKGVQHSRCASVYRIAGSQIIASQHDFRLARLAHFAHHERCVRLDSLSVFTEFGDLLFRFRVIDFPLQFSPPGLLFGRERQIYRWTVKVPCYPIALLFYFKGRVVEESQHPVVVGHRERFILVVVTLCALECCAKEYRAGGVHTVDHLVDSI